MEKKTFYVYKADADTVPEGYKINKKGGISVCWKAKHLEGDIGKAFETAKKCIPNAGEDVQ